MIKAILFVFRHLNSVLDVSILNLKGELFQFSKLTLKELIDVLKKKEYKGYTVKLTFTIKI
jgi:hypothetical protein